MVASAVIHMIAPPASSYKELVVKVVDERKGVRKGNPRGEVHRHMEFVYEGKTTILDEPSVHPSVFEELGVVVFEFKGKAETGRQLHLSLTHRIK